MLPGTFLFHTSNAFFSSAWGFWKTAGAVTLEVVLSSKFCQLLVLRWRICGAGDAFRFICEDPVKPDVKYAAEMRHARVKKTEKREILVRVDLDVDADVMGETGRLCNPHPAGRPFPVQSWDHVTSAHLIYQQALPTSTRSPLQSRKPALRKSHVVEAQGTRPPTSEGLTRLAS